MRVLFIVQGEGRGHLTQAISLLQLLQEAGHQVVGAWVSVAKERPVPIFFREQFNAPVFTLVGPLLVYDPLTNALNLRATVAGILTDIPIYWQSVRQLRQAIEEHQPDVVVNFFELLAGLTYAIYRTDVPMVCVAHQCMGLHPTFPFPKGQLIDRLLFKALIRLNSWGASQRVGLSFDEQPDHSEQRLRVVPPLLRQELTRRQRLRTTNAEAMILAYTTQPGLQSEILRAHHQCPDVPIDYFHPQTTRAEKQTESLRFRPVDGQRYLDAMQHCQAIMTTAGFESVCEALYLGKPVQMRPMPNHFEQACNALDGQRVGAGMATDTFDLPKLLTYIKRHDDSASDRFRAWYIKETPRFVAILNQVVNRPKPTRTKRTVLRPVILLKPSASNSF